MFATAVLPQLIGEVVSVVIAYVFLGILVGGFYSAHEYVSELSFFKYRDIPRLKHLPLERPMTVTSPFWPEKGMFYVLYEGDHPRETTTVNLGRKYKALQKGDSLKIVKGRWYGRSVQILPT